MESTELAPRGSAGWLIAREQRYGGRVSGVPRRKVSPFDPRTKVMLGIGGMTGGDRMQCHGYAPAYAEYLRGLTVGDGDGIVLAEFGVLRGTGLAIWCDLFPKGRILGFDIDLSHINDNMAALEELGAFALNRPELYEVDQFVDNEKYLGDIMKGGHIDVCIDDGFHAEQTVLTTMASVVPYLSTRCVYFVEDNSTVAARIRALYPDFDVDSRGELTIVTR